MKKPWWEKLSFRAAAAIHALLAAGSLAAALYSFRQPTEGDWPLLGGWFLFCGGVCAWNALGAYRERYRDRGEEDP